MLQQTQVSRVLGYYERFLLRFPTIKSLAKASWEEFLPYYAGLGYYSRGRNMLKTAQTIMEDFGGKFPTTLRDLESLPGVGPYTARAIASFAAGAPYLAWDTNLKRVIGRFFRGGKDQLRDDDVLVFDKELGKNAPKLNAALMDFGSSICVARPKCEACMLRHECLYYKTGGKKEVKKKRKIEKDFDMSEARAIVYLHEHHRKYFSSRQKTYEPFLLPKGYADRAGIKTFFKKQYGLELSVRPAHRKTTLSGKPVLLVNAQILLGKVNFPIFLKADVRGYDKIKAWK